jgi:hypothetical protein
MFSCVTVDNVSFEEEQEQRFEEKESKALFGRAPALAPPSAPAGALPNDQMSNGSGGGASKNPVTRAVWVWRSHKNVASTGSTSPFLTSPLVGSARAW